MFPWRGIAPVLYHLYDAGREVGTVTRLDDGTIVVSLRGFSTSTAAASAAWIAYAARRAYEAEVGALWSGDGPGAAGDGRPPVAAGAVRELVAHDDGGEIALHRGGEEIARLSNGDDTDDDGAPLWSVRLVVGPADTPVVFALAATRRIWEAVRRSGLTHEMRARPAGVPAR